MMTLKLIAQIWRREHENRNAEKIADRAGRMYDQVALIVDSMLDSQKKLGAVNQSFEKAMNRLKDGRGNLVGRIEQLRELGAKVNKQIDQKVIEDSSPPEDDSEE
jgi:DNA recombination protein RmuC